jgi:hypothetical protein
MHAAAPTMAVRVSALTGAIGGRNYVDGVASGLLISYDGLMSINRRLTAGELHGTS